MDNWLDSRTFIPVLFLWLSFQHTGSSCTDDQAKQCHKAAEAGKLSRLPGGGKCQPHQYVHYTHLCTVDDYRPSMDFCCCALQQKVLCCRYHQAWDRFRCSEPEDTIAVISHRDVPLNMLLPAILGPVLLLVCCLVCCFRCHGRLSSLTKKRRKETPVSTSHDSNMQPMTPYSMGNQIGRVPPEMEPLNSQSPVITNFIENKRPLDGYIPDRTCLEPSAPPVCMGQQVAPPYDVAVSHRSSTSSSNSNSPASPPPPDVYIRPHSPPGDATPHTCPSCAAPHCAPPSYEESRQHPIMHHH